MRLNALNFAGLLALVLLAVPVWAHTDSAVVESNGDVSIAGTHLKSGEYQLKVENNANQLQVTQNGKVITQVPVKWIQLNSKANATEVDINSNQIVEVDFAGKNQAVQIQGN